MQPNLLRALERSEIRRVGGDRCIKVDVLLLAATRRDLDLAVQARELRDDLIHRLAVARIELPPLRHRRGDVRTLVHRFWKEFGGDSAMLTESLLRRWDSYNWPGNVRELRNAVSRQCALGALADDFRRTPSAAPNEASTATDVLQKIVLSGAPFFQARDLLMEEFEERYVSHVLAQHGGDVARAAAASGIGRRYFYKLRARQAVGARSDKPDKE